MITTSLQRDAMTETYLDVQGLIYDTCHKFNKVFNGDIEEYISIANTVFIKAYQTHNPNISKFTTWLRRCIWGKLFDYTRKEIKDYKRNCSERVAKDTNFTTTYFIDLLDELDDDAKDIVHMIFDMPALLKEMTIENNCTMLSFKSTLRKYLKNIGWTADTINKSFQEIIEVISAN